MRPALVSGPPNRKKPYNKHLISLVFSVRTVNYGSSFFSIGLWPARFARNLQYGPKTRLIRGIYSNLYYDYYPMKYVLTIGYIQFFNSCPLSCKGKYHFLFQGSHHSPHVRESRTVFRIPGTGFQCFSVELGFRISIVSRIQDSLSCIPDSKAHDSGYHRQKCPRFQNPDSLTLGDTISFPSFDAGSTKNKSKYESLLKQ